MSAPDQKFLPPPVTCERLEQMVVRCGGSMTFHSAEGKIDYPLPTYASGEIRDFLRKHATVDFGRGYVAHLPGGRVFGSGNVLSPDGRTIARDVSPDFGKAFEEHWLLGYQKIRPPLSLPGATAVVATTLGTGYSHWLLDELPRLIALRSGECETLIAHATSPCALDALALHGFSGKLIHAKRDSHWSSEQLTVPSLGQLTPAIVRATEEFTAPLHGMPAVVGERLYVSREKARRRRVANEAELWPLLDSRGFVKIHLEELTWAQQINAFRTAKIIVAPHGAGLANLVFCQPGTTVVEFFHRSYVNGCFWQLAALKGLDYRPVVSPGVAPLAETLSANRLDIEADLAEILRALSSTS